MLNDILRQFSFQNLYSKTTFSSHKALEVVGIIVLKPTFFSMMRAARFYAQRDLRVENISNPEAKANDVLVEIEWCGICGSDIHEYLIGLFLDWQGSRNLKTDNCLQDHSQSPNQATPTLLLVMFFP